MIYANFESILVPHGNKKQNSDEFCAIKCQKHVAWSYGYESVLIANKFS